MVTVEAPEPTEVTTTAFGLPIDPAILFSDKKGRYNKGIEKRRMKVLQKLGFLQRFLDPEERVILVTTGCSPFTTLEQFTIGALWVILLKRAVFVFTNQRLLHIPTTMQYEYRGSLAQVLYQDCRLSVKGSMLVAEYRDGRKEQFYGIPGADRAIIKRLQIEPEASEQSSDAPRRNHLCPNCGHTLEPGMVTCPACGLAFKSRAKALKYSLLIPGGGYFYANHPFLGIGDALAEAYLTLLMLGWLAAGLLGEPEALAALVFVGAILTLEKLLTVYHSNSFLAEFIPVNLQSVLSGQIAPPEPRPSPSVPQPEPESRQRIEDVLSAR